MDVPQRNSDLRRLGYNLQRDESECYRVPGRTPANTRNHLSSQAPSSMQGQLQKSASNQVPTQAPGNMRNNAQIPFPSSCTAGQTTVGNLPYSSACIPQSYAFKNVSSETHRSAQVTTKHPNTDNSMTTLQPAYRESTQDCGKYGQQAHEVVFANQSNRVEGARAFRTVSNNEKVPDVRNVAGYPQRCTGEKSNYINPKLVQKVLECQKKRAQTPVSHLRICNKEVPLVSAGQRNTRFEKPEHHSSDTSLSNKMVDLRIADPETVSTGSQKESGYQSGDSVGDRSSENSEPGRNMRWPTVAQPFPAIPDAPGNLHHIIYTL